MADSTCNRNLFSLRRSSFRPLAGKKDYRAVQTAANEYLTSSIENLSTPWCFPSVLARKIPQCPIPVNKCSPFSAAVQPITEYRSAALIDEFVSFVGILCTERAKAFKQ
jgi:hypothetical protein